MLTTIIINITDVFLSLLNIHDEIRLRTVSSVFYNLLTNYRKYFINNLPLISARYFRSHHYFNYSPLDNHIPKWLLNGGRFHPYSDKFKFVIKNYWESGMKYSLGLASNDTIPPSTIIAVYRAEQLLDFEADLKLVDYDLMVISELITIVMFVPLSICNNSIIFRKETTY